MCAYFIPSELDAKTEDSQKEELESKKGDRAF